MQIELSILIAVIGAAISVATFFLGRTTAAKNSGKEYGVMLTDIGYIKAGVDDMKRKMEQSDKRYIELSGTVTAISGRVDALEEKMQIYHHGGAA